MIMVRVLLIITLAMNASAAGINLTYLTYHKTSFETKSLIAHRGASGYAPEHTSASYQLAIAQGANFVEPDLQVTRDGVLVCLHDSTLERTTNAAQVFPDRFKLQGTVKHWNVYDFTLEELKSLDAGSWFDPRFKGEKILTFQEMIDLVKDKAGIYPETKSPDTYGRLGFDMEKLVLTTLKKNHLDLPGANPKTPVIIQSFSPESLRKLRFELKTRLPLVLLVSAIAEKQWLSAEGLKAATEFANGIGPDKKLVDGKPELVQAAHKLGLTVTLYTVNEKGRGRFKSISEEMSYYLYDLGVDALFTDNPDKFPRQKIN